MSKNKMIILILLIGVTIVCANQVSKTYAKYTSSVGVSDSARVAIWDVSFGEHAKEIDLFSKSYLCDENGENCAVDSINGDKIVAPGTSGKYSFQINVNAETNYTVDIRNVDIKDDIGRLEYELCADGNCDSISIEELKIAISGLIPKNIVYPAGFNYKTDEYTIKWKWPYDISDEDNNADTKLGNEAVVDKKNPLYDAQKRVKIAFDIVVEQSQDKANS